MINKNSKSKQSVLFAEHHNKKIKIKCIVSGKSIAPYCIPKKIKIKCKPESGKNCSSCPIKNKSTITVESKDERILRYIDIQSSQLKSVISQTIGIQCDFEFEVLEMQNIERLFILPPISKTRFKQPIAPISYYIGGDIKVNTLYDMVGYTTIDPKNQTSVHVFTKADRTKTDVDMFEMTEERHKALSAFCSESDKVEELFEHLDKLYEYYAHNVTKIYDRFDLHLAVDLVFKSVMSFRFDNELVNKGWMDIMIIGDTRCGKGFVAEKLSKYFGLGDVISGDNVSFAGLVGGLQQFSGHWVITWGKIPLNDGGLVIIDEASEIGHSDWTRLSRIRSEGVAEITKIHTQVTQARTRLIFISNPILKTISNYSYGIQSISEVVKSPEDIARFDYVLVVAHNEVDVEDINKRRDLKEQIYSPKLEQDLILWAWSKKPNEIQFSEKAISYIYKMSIKLSETYTFKIPLIQGENIRVKLSRIALSFAVRFYSNKDSGKILFIDRIHAECAVHFLNLIYKKKSCGYHDMSKIVKVTEGEMSDSNIIAIEKYFDSYTLKRDSIYKCLLNIDIIDAKDICKHASIDEVLGNEIIYRLLENSCISKYKNSFIKTSGFTEYLKVKILGERDV